MHITHFPLEGYTDRLVSVATREPVEITAEFTECVQEYVGMLIETSMRMRPMRNRVIDDFRVKMEQFGGLAGLTAEQACADNNVISQNRPWPANNFEFIDEVYNGTPRNLFCAAYEKLVIKTVYDWNMSMRGNVIDSTMIHRLQRALHDTAEGLQSVMLRPGHPNLMWVYEKLTRQVEGHVDSISALRGLRSYHEETIGHQLSFSAPSHDFTLIIDREFRQVDMEGGACWCIPGIEKWLPKTLDFQIN